MINLTVTINTDEVIRKLRLAEAAVYSAAAAALNDTANSVRGNAVKEIALETGETQSYIRKKLYIARATRSNLIAVVGALPSARNLGKYRKSNAKQQRAGAAVTAWNTRKVYRGTFIMGGAKATGTNNKVWRRTGPGKNDITSTIWGPSIRATFIRPHMVAKHRAVVSQRFPVFFERRLRGALIRAGVDLKGVGSVL